MTKKKGVAVSFRCSECGHTQPKWLGRCPSCGEWNTFEEQVTEDSVPIGFGTRNAADHSTDAYPIPLENVAANDAVRISTGIGELDRVLGGGTVKRSAILIGGEPGIGKSTLLLQTAAASGQRTLYVSGEESAGQIRGRADRLNIPLHNIELLCTSYLENIEKTLNNINPIVIIIDSIQTLFSPQAGAIPGTVNQLKYCANELVMWVKEHDAVLFFTAHVTKEGSIAGPKVLEHLVDTVIYFEHNEEDIRFLRVLKNRFGSVDELGIFRMEEHGLVVFMVEIQALTVPTKGTINRVFSDKIDSARVSRIAAVLEKRIGLRFSDQDMYINVAGGIRLRDPSIDLALAFALYSTRTDIPVKKHEAFIGELSLSGEIRPVRRLKALLKTAKSLGFTTFYVPAAADNEDIDSESGGIVRVEQLAKAIQSAFASG